MSAFTVGQKVYRVIDGDDEDEYEVQERTVARVTPQRVTLDRPFSYCAATHGLIPTTRAVRLFFASAAAAVGDHAQKMRRNLADAESEAVRCRKALAWCAEQHEVKP